MSDPAVEAINNLAHIENAVTKAGYNCSCAATPDNVSIDKDWLDYHLRELKKALLRLAPATDNAELSQERQAYNQQLGKAHDTIVHLLQDAADS